MTPNPSSSYGITAAMLAAICASALSAQGLQEQKIPRNIPDQHDFKPLTQAPSDKPWLPPTPMAQDAARQILGKPPRAGIDLPQQAYSRGPLSLDDTKVYYDDRADGTIWADGRNYKAGFGKDGFTYVPFFGSEAPKDYPVLLTVSSARVGSQILKLNAAAQPQRNGDRIVFDRGSLLEIYDLKPRGVEQTIQVVETQAAGAVTVQITVGGELMEDDTMAGIQFTNALGRVDYGSASLVRTDGSKSEIESSFAAGTITLMVGEGQREALGQPVTIDPLISTFNLATAANYAFRHPDIAYDLSTDAYLVVWERVFSATDSDVWSELRNRNGTPIAGSYASIDNSVAESWSWPRVANLNAYHRYLVVAEVAGTPRVIKGRTREAALPVVTGSTFVVSGGEAGDKRDPDIGGDPSSSIPTYWTVVYTRSYSVTDTDIHARQIDSTTAAHGATILIENSASSLHYNPQISNSDGALGASSQHWMVVWTLEYTATDHDIYGAVIDWDGTVSKAAFQISTSTQEDFSPAVSSPADAWATPGYLVAWERGSTKHIHGLVLNALGNVVVPSTDLSLLQGLAASSVQYGASVESDGCRFALSYVHGTPGYIVPLHVAYGALGASEPRVKIDNISNAHQIRLCATHSGRGPGLDYGIIFTDYLSPLPDVVRGAVYQGYAPGGYTTRPTGCGGLGITTSGIPSIGGTASFTMTGQGSDLVGMMFGLPSSTPLCGSCVVGVNLSAALLNFPNQSTLNLPIPCQGDFIGVTVSAQGYSFGTPTCFSVLRLGATADCKIQ